MSDYEILLNKYQQSQTECRQLKQKLTSTEAELKSLENAFGPAVDEYDHLRRRLQIEAECRSEAEKYACKMKKANKELKRRSMEILQHMNLVNIDIEDNIDSGVVSGSSEDDLRDTLNKKQQELEMTVKVLESKLEASEEEKLAAYHRELKLTANIQELEDENADLREKLEDYNKNMKSIRRASNLAWDEFEELKKKYELAIQLKNEAERYAHQMLTERDVIKRESAMLLASSMVDERVASALLTIEELSVQLSNEQHSHKTEVESLQQQLNSCSQQIRISDLEQQLSLALAENETLLKAHKELIKWKEKLEKENVDLVNKLDVAEQKLRPPPPPPPPPPSFFSPLRLFIRKKPASETNSTKTRSGAPRDQTYEEALKEMMDRIKSGRALKPASEMAQHDKTDGSAIDNLQSILTRREVSVDELLIRRRQEQQQQSGVSENSELMTAFKKLRVQPSTDQQTT